MSYSGGQVSGQPGYRGGARSEEDGQSIRGQLRESQEHFRDLVEHAPVGITLLDLEGRLLDANPAVCELLGYSREELVGRSAARFVARATEPQRAGALAALIEGRERSTTYNVAYLRKDGTQRLGEVVATVLRDGEGQPQSIIGLIQDVTERHELEAQLSAQADLIDLAHDAIFVKRLADNRITFWNPGAERLYGYTAEQAIGRASDELLRTEPDGARHAAEELRRTGDWAGQLMQLTASGEPVWVESRWALLRDLDGQPFEALQTNRDITAQRALTEERERLVSILERQNRELRETDKLKTEFLLTISHELRTPLTAILGFADLLATDSSVSEREELEIIRRNGRRLLTIIEDILTLAQVQAGELKLSSVPLNLSAVVERATEKARRAAREKGLELVAQGLDRQAWVTGDEVATSHVLRHLLGNAIKFTATGRVTVVLEQTDAEAVVRVEDTGIGVPAAKRELIFEEFRQADQSMTRQHGGVGVGLSVVRNLVALQGGKLGLQDRPGGGSVFWFTLPAAPPPTD